MLYDFGEGQNGAIVESFVVFVAEVEVASCAAFASWLGKVGGVGVEA